MVQACSWDHDGSRRDSTCLRGRGRRGGQDDVVVRALPCPGDLAGHSQRPLHRRRVPDGLWRAPPRHQAPLRTMAERIAVLLWILHAQIRWHQLCSLAGQAGDPQTSTSVVPEGQGDALPELHVLRHVSDGAMLPETQCHAYDCALHRPLLKERDPSCRISSEAASGPNLLLAGVLLKFRTARLSHHMSISTTHLAAAAASLQP